VLNVILLQASTLKGLKSLVIFFQAWTLETGFGFFKRGRLKQGLDGMLFVVIQLSFIVILPASSVHA